MLPLITKYFPNLSESQQLQFTRLNELYPAWNSKINLISRQDINDLDLKHILHSLSIAKFIQFKPNTQIVDIGTGGGFPGIPLAIMFPESNFTLVDSIGKKIKVVNHLIQDLDLKNAVAINDRIENLNLTPHFYTSRAVTSLATLLIWINRKVSPDNFNSHPNGLITLKGGDITDELRHAPQTEVVPLSQYYKEEFFETKLLTYSARPSIQKTV